MVKPLLEKPFILTALGLAMAVGAFLALGTTAVLADENMLLEIEPISSAELSSATGGGLGAGVQGLGDDLLRRRATKVNLSVDGGQKTGTSTVRQTRQISSTSLGAVNDLVSISNLAGAAGTVGGGRAVNIANQ